MKMKLMVIIREECLEIYIIPVLYMNSDVSVYWHQFKQSLFLGLCRHFAQIKRIRYVFL